jgi:acyl-CoA synthetase (AMP-forming)/AMP-acid ligase II
MQSMSQLSRRLTRPGFSILSGTTRRPKGAVLSHRNLLAMALYYLAEINPLAPGEALLHAAPMSHGSRLARLSFAVTQ